MHVRICAGGGQQWPFLPRKNRMHGSRWQGLETNVATDGELCTTGKPAWNRRAPALRHAPRQPLTLLELELLESESPDTEEAAHRGTSDETGEIARELEAQSSPPAAPAGALSTEYQTQ